VEKPHRKLDCIIYAIDERRRLIGSPCKWRARVIQSVFDEQEL